MDPITATIVWGVVWFFATGLAAPIVWVCASVGLVVGDGHDGPFVLAGVVGWILGFAWSVFCIIQVILHIVDLVQLLT